MVDVHLQAQPWAAVRGSMPRRRCGAVRPGVVITSPANRIGNTLEKIT
jgi:hypothetical protein